MPESYDIAPNISQVFINKYKNVFCNCLIVFFFLPGKIKIQDILACSFLDDLLEVDILIYIFVFCISSSRYWSNSNSIFMFIQLRDEDLSKESQETNWFSAPSALRVYGMFQYTQ